MVHLAKKSGHHVIYEQIILLPVMATLNYRLRKFIAYCPRCKLEIAFEASMKLTFPNALTTAFYVQGGNKECPMYRRLISMK